jgi:hypothetical protein
MPKPIWIDTKDPSLRRTPTGAVACIHERKDGSLCNSVAMVNQGSLYCVKHASKKGVARMSRSKAKSMPRGLEEKFEEAQRDPDLLSARADAALLEARSRELLERLSTGESGQLWDDLHSTLTRFEENGGTDPAALVKSLKQIVERGRADEATWRQLHEVIEQKTKVAASEWKRLVDMKQVITAEKAMAFSMHLLEVVMKYVPEPDRRKQIAGEVRSLMHVQQATVIEAR